MQKSRREFAKKTAIVTAGVTTVASTSVLATTTSKSEEKTSGNGVVKGNSRKNEILYTKTAAWEEYYKNAK